MTFEERLAALGVDLSDLPTEYSEPHLWKAYDALFDWNETRCGWNDPCELLAPFVLHLIDVIDRMETRLINVTGERDWMQSKCCALCFKAYEDGSDACDTCDIDEGVPEDRRLDDD